MGLDSIIFFGTAAGAMVAEAPTSDVIKGNSGDAYIVGFSKIGGTAGDDLHETMTCAGDPRWEANGVILPSGAVDTALGVGGFHAPVWFPVKIPIRCGATLAVTQTGATNEMLVIYVDYPQFGEPFKVRNPAVSQPTAFMTSRMFTAGAALTSLTIMPNSVGVATFQRGKSYTPLSIALDGTYTTAFFVGIQNTKHNLTTYWPMPLGPVGMSTQGLYPLPYGLGTVDGGETQFLSFYSFTADTPVVHINFAYA